MRGLVAGLVLIATFGACGNNGDATRNVAALQKAADTAAITQIEYTFHKAVSVKSVDLLMTLWADNAVLTVGGHTFVGKSEVRDFWATTAAPFRPEAKRWISETPAYKTRITVTGERGTLYFECHFVDVDTRQVKLLVADDAKVARINGHWLITSGVTEAASLT
jgi:hypothetical protein